jgi:hypothetical protein
MEIKMNFELDMLASEFLDIIGFKGYSEYLINKFESKVNKILNSDKDKDILMNEDLEKNPQAISLMVTLVADLITFAVTKKYKGKDLLLELLSGCYNLSIDEAKKLDGKTVNTFLKELIIEQLPMDVNKFLDEFSKGTDETGPKKELQPVKKN